MAAAIIAIRNNQSDALDAVDEDEESLLDHLRSNLPSKENRDAELHLSVLVLG